MSSRASSVKSNAASSWATDFARSSSLCMDVLPGLLPLRQTTETRLMTGAGAFCFGDTWARTAAVISRALTVFETKNEMHVHIRLARTRRHLQSLYPHRGLIVRTPFFPSLKSSQTQLDMKKKSMWPRWKKSLWLKTSVTYVKIKVTCRIVIFWWMYYNWLCPWGVPFGAADAKRYTTSAAAKWRKPLSKSWRVINMHVNACHKKCRNFVMPQYFFKQFSMLASSLNPP